MWTATRRRLTGAYRAHRYRTTSRPSTETTSPDAGRAFLRSLLNNGDPDRAAVALVRALLDEGALGRARTTAQAFQLHAGTAAAGDIGQALVALRERDHAAAWQLLRNVDVRLAVQLAPAEYFRAAFSCDLVAARRTLRAIRDGEIALAQGPRIWADIARSSFAGGAEDLSRWALDHAVAGTDSLPPETATRLRRDAQWLRQWYGRSDAPTPTAPAGQISFAVLDYKQPDRARTSGNLGDPVQTLASLGHLVRRTGLRFTGDTELATFAEQLRERVVPARRVDGDDATVALLPVDRDASRYARIPQGTWAFVFGWYMHPLFGIRFELPLDPRLEPLFISFHINSPELLTGPAIAYLRRYAPIGCRDRNTVRLLTAAGVPAFFSGCLTTTLDLLFPPNRQASPAGTVWVDVPHDGADAVLHQDTDEFRDAPLATNLQSALERVGDYRDRYRRVITSRLHCYLPARTIGADVEFRPTNSANVRLDGLLDLDDDRLAAMRAAIESKLSAVLDAILAGKPAAEVREVWRAVCAADVAISQRPPVLPPVRSPGFDLDAVCGRVRAASVIIERRAEPPPGPEIRLEFSLDGNLRSQFAVVLDAAVRHSSRPIRAYVLCRDHTDNDFRTMARRFPSVSFVWLPTDTVDFGAVRGMIKHITVATMDRLLLPTLLPEVDRIVHHDVDALPLADLAELHDLELLGHPLAGRPSPHAAFRSGFREFIRASERLGPDRAAEFIARTHTRHQFDFVIVNAGILVLDLARMRADGFGTEFLPYAFRYGLNDQAVLNAYAGADRVELAPSWNWHPRLETLDAPRIAHWAGPLKPWGSAWVQGRELWRDAERRLAGRDRTVVTAG